MYLHPNTTDPSLPACWAHDRYYSSKPDFSRSLVMDIGKLASLISDRFPLILCSWSADLAMTFSRLRMSDVLGEHFTLHSFEIWRSFHACHMLPATHQLLLLVLPKTLLLMPVKWLYMGKTIDLTFKPVNIYMKSEIVNRLLELKM